jgi:hypothetical protein
MHTRFPKDWFRHSKVNGGGFLGCFAVSFPVETVILRSVVLKLLVCIIIFIASYRVVYALFLTTQVIIVAQNGTYVVAGDPS